MQINSNSKNINQAELNQTKMQRALFLDRDGIINKDHGYVVDASEFDFMPGIFSLIRRAMQSDYKVIVVTNQSGIARGYYSSEQFWELTDWMLSQCEKEGAQIDDVFFCPHHPKAGDTSLTFQCDCRKPAPGMFLKAAEKHKLCMASSIMLGDKKSDMEAAIAAGITQNYWFCKTETISFNQICHPDNKLISLINDFKSIKFAKS